MVLRRECAVAQCGIASWTKPQTGERGPVVLRGQRERLQRVAHAAGVPLYTNGPDLLVRKLEPVMSAVMRPGPSSPPLNWELKSLDLESLRWSAPSAGPTAHEYTSRYGATRYFVDEPERGLVELDRRTAIYAAGHAERENAVPNTTAPPVSSQRPLQHRCRRRTRVRLGCVPGRSVLVLESRLVYRDIPTTIGDRLVTCRRTTRGFSTGLTPQAVRDA